MESNKKYHIIKLTQTEDGLPRKCQVLTTRPFTRLTAIHWFLLELIQSMRWSPHLIDSISLESEPDYLDIEEYKCINWNPEYLLPESKLRWAMWKIKADGRYTVPGHEDDDEYGKQTYLLAEAQLHTDATFAH